MKRKMKFSKTVSLIIVFGILISVLSGILCGCQKEYEMDILTSEIDAGATATFTVLHTSDTHLTLCSDTDTAEIKEKSKKRTKRFKNLQESKLNKAASMAKEKGYYLVHTGDIMDFPTDANIERAKAFFEETNCLYVPGNHEPEDQDSDYYKKLNAAYRYDIDFYCQEINGVNFVGIDNSDHKMTEEQLKKLKSVVAQGKPVILLVHAPLYTKELYDASVVDDGSAYLMAVPETLMKNYPAEKYAQQKADEITYAAYDYIVSRDCIKGILCGHLHIDFETKVGGRIPQYVVGLDSMRVVTVK
ncbi:MAG: metallophosphoesterase [Clostridia bacterium]|nr:metallophosphoesterase [Clostridia bacterium]